MSTKQYKTDEKQRERALKYYYDRRDGVRAKGEVDNRKTAGMSKRRTEEDRLKDILYCTHCSKQITSRTDILNRRKRCPACKSKKKRERLRAQGLTSKGTPIKPSGRSKADKEQEFIELRALMSCARCGLTDPECLDFHHRDPGEKDFAISERGGVSFEELLDEMLKCDVLCANCHRKEHRKAS